MIARVSTKSSAQVTEKQVAYLIIIEIILLFHDFLNLFLIYSFFLGLHEFKLCRLVLSIKYTTKRMS